MSIELSPTFDKKTVLTLGSVLNLASTLVRSAWPVPVDVMIDITEADWRTDATLRERVITARISGRGAARRADDVRLFLPTTCGTVDRP